MKSINTVLNVVHLLIICFANIQAQNLGTEFNLISSNNDLMGGSLVTFCSDGIEENLAIGMSDYDRNINMSIDTKYRIASISKTITAIAIMQLVEQNLLDIDADISTILGYTVENPYFTSSPITTRMLLSHTSTIIDGPTYNSFLNDTNNTIPTPNLSEILVSGGNYYSISQFNNTLPGTYFNYSNINYIILGTIVEKLTNLRFDIYCKQNISDPLGIDASFNVNDLNNIDQLAVIYRKINNIWTAQVDNYQGVQPLFNNLDNYIPGTNGGLFNPQGGFRCSAQDLAKIFLVLMNEGTYDGVNLLSTSSCSLMLSNAWTYNGSNGNNYYGLFLSWGLGIHRITSTPANDIALPGSQSLYGHSGEAYGLVSNAYFDLDRNFGFIFMNNGIGAGYQTNNNSVFYTVEQDVFNAIENLGNIANCSQTMSLNEMQSPGFNIYPNPCSKLVFINHSKTTPLHVNIYNSAGVLIKAVILESQDNQINIEDLEQGLYFISINNQISKLIKV
ncbi:MAG: serine hydrolase [Winogradskyella sp.]|uniref:serine hydrolase n=1 Tax=Winogradskyella sp. TaxID=1883156 RepID=UPI0025E0CFEB|nr:serine hydrolase [Winogradskyella sp.]NRB60327.1 serine hydrolase [Winogradskyella sp.]